MRRDLPPTLEKNECDVVGLLANFVIHILIDDCLAFSLSDGTNFSSGICSFLDMI